MDVSIVIVSYNVAGYLRGCLDSIRKETSCAHEIIVVDNNSTDDSVAIAGSFMPGLKLVQKHENVGFARANNQGFGMAQGRYIFMLNPDVVVMDRAIDKLVDFMDKNPEIGACGPKNVSPDMSLQLNCHHFPTLSMILVEYLRLKRKFQKRRFFGREHMTYWSYDEVKDVDWITGASLMIRKEALDEVGWLDEDYFMYSEESDLCYRLKKKRWRVAFYPEASILHYGGQSSLSQQQQTVHSKTITKYLHQSRYLFFRKNYGKGREWLLRALDILYFSLSYVKNKVQFRKSDRQEKMDYARIVLRLALNRY
jgi:GT2 family glycosyltransferase